MISIALDEDEITEAIDGLLALLGDMTPVMQQIGEHLILSTKERFVAGVSPEGTPWAPKSPVTRGNDRRPLFGPTGLLSSQIFSEPGPDSVTVGSARIYAAMMQFGGSKAAFPHLWGDIPARPFLGISESDRSGILEIVSEWLERAASPGPS